VSAPSSNEVESAPLAHSAQDGRPPQTYAAHVTGVLRRACANADAAHGERAKFRATLVRAVRLGAEFHDLGKLDPANQKILGKPDSRESLPVKHWDAGVAALLRDGEIRDSFAAALVYAHHKGLPNFAAEQNRQTLAFREDEIVPGRPEPTCAFNDARLTKFLERHWQALASEVFPPVPPPCGSNGVPPLFHRLALSCLVDADHTDTAFHRTGVEPPPGLPLLPGKRLAALERYVGRLGTRYAHDTRTALRQRVFEECLQASTSPNLLFCDSPVGSGKTTAIMAHLLRAAEAKTLRRIFVVLPFTNIITQSARVYRCALTLRGEKASKVVGEHHHRAEFPEGQNDRNAPARQYAELWHAPIVVVTAVQFFETLAAADTVSLRKLHQLPGSAIFIDEAHAALPAKLWPQAFRWLLQLTEDWGCHCVLASGSLPEFWRLPQFVETKTPVSLPNLLPAGCRSEAANAETTRVQICAEAEPLSLDALTMALQKLPGPRLLVVNTVQNAAVIAQHLSIAWNRDSVEHVSTAITPEDRETTYDHVKRRLANLKDDEWTLVATSCVEAGVDLDFACGLRERAGLMSLLQLSGRVNRHGRRNRGPVIDFSLAPHALLNKHPAFEHSALVLGELFAEGRVTASECLEAMKRELNRYDLKPFLEQIRIQENGRNFPEVEELFRVISANTVTAVVNPDLIERLQNYESVRFRDLQRGSVQLWLGKERAFELEEFVHLPGVYRWNLGYDKFLGVMKGILTLRGFLDGKASIL
jgi:CRISPR-associated endonuclease/helicase Cas3